MFVLESSKRIACGWALLVLLFLSSPIHANPTRKPPLKVLASIKPLSLLAKDLLQEHAEVETLLPEGADPHHYALKISDVERIKNADWVIWLGPQMEMFLTKLLKDHPGSLALMDGLHFKEHAHPAEDHQHGLDPHVWLSPHYVTQIQQLIFKALTQKDAALADALEAQKNRLALKWEHLENKFRVQVQPFKNSPFAVNHPAYEYFVDHFGLNQVAVVNPSEETRLSAKKIVQLKHKVKNASCLLVEAQTSQNEKLGKTLGLRTVVLHPLGTDKNAESFEQFFVEFTNSFLKCFKGN